MMIEPVKVHMNPNSQHQLWSLWTWKVTPYKKQMISFGAKRRHVAPSRARVEEVKTNIARYANKFFGNTGQMNVKQFSDGVVVVKVRVEGHPVHDPQYVQFVRTQWHRFLKQGFGNQVSIEFHAKLEAGDAQNGKPADQLVILPPFHIGVEHK